MAAPEFRRLATPLLMLHDACVEWCVGYYQEPCKTQLVMVVICEAVFAQAPVNLLSIFEEGNLF